MRSILARMLREARGSPANVARGALGISRETCADNARARLTATSIPPALILRAVANSRNSLPLSSRLRTKTGIARGSRLHFRLSVSGPLWFTQTPPVPVLTPCLQHLRGQIWYQVWYYRHEARQNGPTHRSNLQCKGGSPFRS